jgi:hypothetical protein
MVKGFITLARCYLNLVHISQGKLYYIQMELGEEHLQSDWEYKFVLDYLWGMQKLIFPLIFTQKS